MMENLKKKYNRKWKMEEKKTQFLLRQEKKNWKIIFIEKNLRKNKIHEKKNKTKLKSQMNNSASLFCVKKKQKITV